MPEFGENSVRQFGNSKGKNQAAVVTFGDNAIGNGKSADKPKMMY